jgi:hypothetical protein
VDVAINVFKSFASLPSGMGSKEFSPKQSISWLSVTAGLDGVTFAVLPS